MSRARAPQFPSRLLALALWAGWVGSPLLGLAADGAAEPHRSFELPATTHRLEGMAFSHDLRWLAALTTSGRVEVWDLINGSKAADWPATAAQSQPPMARGHRGSLAFLGDNRRIAVAGSTNVVLHDLLSGKVEQVLEETLPGLGQVSVSPADNRAVEVTREFEFVFWSLPGGERLRDLPTKRAPWEPRGSPFNYNAMAMRTPPASLKPETDWAFSPDGRYFAVGRLFAIDLWDLDEKRWLCRYSGMNVADFRIGGPTFGGATSLEFLSSSNLAMVCGGALAVLQVGTDLRALGVTNPAGLQQPAERLQILALAGSADGTRLAIAGMRMGARPSFGDPGNGAVFDVPRHGEIQLWNATPLRRVASIRGDPGEKFGAVALNASGKRVAAVTTGVTYTPRMNGGQQRGAEFAPSGPYRVVTWDVP